MDRGKNGVGRWAANFVPEYVGNLAYPKKGRSNRFLYQRPFPVIAHQIKGDWQLPPAVLKWVIF